MQPSLSRLLESSARLHPGRPAVIREDGATSYAELAGQVERLAGRLEELGMGGRRIGLLLPNLPVFPLALHGILRSGGSALMLNPLNSPREVAEQLQDAEVEVALTTRGLLGLLPAGVRGLMADELPASFEVVGADGRKVSLEGAPPASPVPEGGDREAAVLYTAADSGRARGAVLTHRNLVANLRSTVDAKRLTPDDRVLALLPLIHAFGLTASLNATLAAGAAVVPVERFSPARVLDLLGPSGATVLSGVPAMFIGLVEVAERKGVPAHRLRLALSGGAPLAEEVQERWEALFGLPLRQGYGLTEAGPVSLFNRLDRPNRRGTLGHPFPNVEVTIRDPAGEILPGGEVGEICVRGENVFPGYLGEPGRDPRQFHGEWLRTGDLGSREPDGVIRFRGLLKAMFTRNGFNVYPREIERVLTVDPRIAEARVGALPDALRENEVVVRVRAAPGAEITEGEVRELCRTQLAAYKQPLRVEVEE